MNASKIDFPGINTAALRDARSLLPDVIPGGKFRGPEYVVRNPRRIDRQAGSFSINYKSGLWRDFSSGDGGGDLISLAAYIWDCSQSEAARKFANKLGVPALRSNGITSSNPDGLSREHKCTAPLSVLNVTSWGEEGPPRQRDEIRRHTYHNGDGVAARVKIKHADGRYKQWYRVGSGWRAKKPDDFEPIPYVTAALNPFDLELKDDLILWPEGERDVDTSSRLNLPAFTFGGVGDGLPTGIEHYLKDRHLVILSDNDDAGRGHSEKKAAIAHAAGAASIRIVHFPELAPKSDVTDFVVDGGTVEELMARIDGAALWSPRTDVEIDGGIEVSRGDWRAKIVRASDLQVMTFPPVRHIVPGYISEGATIIAGKPKVGKSWMTLDLALAATADRFTLGTPKPAQGDVLYLALEDNSRRLKRRMTKLWPSSDAHWPTRLQLVTDWKRADEGGLDDIEDWCSSVTDPVMVIVDTLEKFRPVQNGKTNAYSADYAGVTSLQKIAGKHRIAVVINHHLRKMEADDPFDTVSGTLGLTGAADTIIVLKRHASAVTLHARGRDIEEIETALQFERATCRWTILGAASEVYVSNERAAVLRALTGAGEEGLAVSEIVAATGSNSRGAMDTLLFKMKEGGEIDRVKRGVYALPRGKIGKKERTDGQAADNHGLSGNLSNLSDLTGPLDHKSHEFLPGPPTRRPGFIGAEEDAGGTDG